MNVNTILSSLDFFIQKKVLHELSLGRWRKYGTKRMSAITKKRKLDKKSVRLQHRVKINLTTGRMIIPVESAKEQGKWSDVPEYEPQIVPVGTGNKSTTTPKGKVKAVYIDYTSKGHYTVMIDFQNMKSWLNDFFKSYKRNREKYVGRSKGEMIQNLIREVDVKFHCNCPSFYWQGMQWWLTKQNAAIENVSIPSKVWVPKHKSAGARVLFCKHIIAVLEGLENTKSYLYRKLATEIRKDKIFQPVLQAIWGPDEIIPAAPTDVGPVSFRKGYRPALPGSARRKLQGG